MPDPNLIWRAFPEYSAYHVGQYDENDRLVHTHPIPFDSQRDAERAAARLNAQEET